MYEMEESEEDSTLDNLDSESNGCSENAHSKKLTEIWFDAIKENDLEFVRKLLKDNPTTLLNEKNTKGETAGDIALSYHIPDLGEDHDYSEMVKLFLTYKNPIFSGKQEHGCSLKAYATFLNKQDIIQIIEVAEKSSILNKKELHYAAHNSINVSGHENNCGLFALLLAVKLELDQNPQLNNLVKMPSYFSNISSDLLVIKDMEVFIDREQEIRLESIGTALRKELADSLLKNDNYKESYFERFANLCVRFLKEPFKKLPQDIQNFEAFYQSKEIKKYLKKLLNKWEELKRKLQLDNTRWIERSLSIFKEVPIRSEEINPYYRKLCAYLQNKSFDLLEQLLSYSDTDAPNKMRHFIWYRKLHQIAWSKVTPEDESTKSRKRLAERINTFLNEEAVKLIRRDESIDTNTLMQLALLDKITFNSEGNILQYPDNALRLDSLNNAILVYFVSTQLQDEWHQIYEEYCRQIQNTSVTITANELCCLANYWNVQLTIDFEDSTEELYESFSEFDFSLPNITLCKPVSLMTGLRTHWRVLTKPDYQLNSQFIKDDFSSNKNLENYYKIDSLYSLNNMAAKKPTMVIIKGNSELIKLSLIALINIKLVTHLYLDADAFIIIYQNNLIELIKLGLQVLIINVNKIEDPKIFLENSYFYSELEILQIDSTYYKDTSDNTDEEIWKDFKNIRSDVDKKCDEIISLNKEVAGFIKEDLATISEKIEKLGIPLNDQFEYLNEDQFEFLMELGKKSNFLMNYHKFLKNLYQDSSFSNFDNLSQAWDIKNIISRNDIKKLFLIKPYLLGFDFNQRYYEHNAPEMFHRLIDLAVNNGYVEIIDFLLQSGANITRDCIDSVIPHRTSKHITLHHDLPNFPFAKTIQTSNKRLIDILLNNEQALYDGLAWFLYANEINGIEEIMKHKKIDINKQIKSGIFEGFNLFQLIIYYKRTTLFFKILEIDNTETLVRLSNQLYPDIPSFKYANWSIIAVVIHLGQYDILMALYPPKLEVDSINMQNIYNYNAVQLIFHGASEYKSRKSHYTVMDNYFHFSRSESHHKILNIYEKCLDYLLKFKYPDFNLISSTIFSTKNNSNLSILHFCVYNHLVTIIKKYIMQFQNILLEKIYIREIEGEVNPLQLVIVHPAYTGNMRGMDKSDIEDESAECLFNIYKVKGLLEIIKENLPPKLGGINLFQFSLICGNYFFVKKLLEWADCPINIPFPLKLDRILFCSEYYLSNYSGLFPIHAAILLDFAFFTSRCFPNSFVDLLAHRRDLDITKPFPAGSEDNNYLTGYYPLSALFYSEFPLKNVYSHFEHQEMPNRLKQLLPLTNNLTLRIRQQILDQALLFAIIHYNSGKKEETMGYIKVLPSRHVSGILSLLEAGANPYQCFGDEGLRIIDVAKEKGLIHLFPNYLTSFNKSIIKQALIKSDNIRPCELNSKHQVSEELSVISLIRNKNSTHPEHVFIIIEKIVNGHSYMYFIDFVHNNAKSGEGKVRCPKPCQGTIKDSLLTQCKEELMQVKNKGDLIIFDTWTVQNQACDKLFASVEEDKKKSINYLAVGNRSILAKSSRKNGHSCYTWACEKLCATELEAIEQALKPTLEEWIGSLPSFKLRDKKEPFYKNRYTFFCVKTSLTIGALAAAALVAYNTITQSKNSVFNLTL